jgi:hypothetical protein
MVKVTHFIGVVVYGRLNPNYSFDVHDVLGTAFIIDIEKGIALTNYHVIPEEDRDKQLAFYTVDENMQLKVAMIDTNSIDQWADKDLIAFKVVSRINIAPDWLTTYPFHFQENMPLGRSVIAMGLPKDHSLYIQDNSESQITVRAFVGHIVSSFSVYYEIDFPFIKGMSGCPIFITINENHRQRYKIAGIAFDNVEIALEHYKTETVTNIVEGVEHSREIYEYKEVRRFGRFYNSFAFKDWLETL